MSSIHRGALCALLTLVCAGEASAGDPLPGVDATLKELTPSPVEVPPRARLSAAPSVDERAGPWACNVDTLVDEGFFRFALPTELGGDNASSMDTIEILEALAAIDASVAWNVMLGSEINAMAAGGMDKDLAKEVYVDNPRVIMCGGGGPGSTE